MSIIEQATKRLEELRRAGVSVPWAAAGLNESEYKASLGAGSTSRNDLAEPKHQPAQGSVPASVVRKLEFAGAEGSAARGGLADRSSDTESELPAQAHSRTVTLDLPQLERAGYLVPNLIRSDLALEFRHIKRPILRNARDAVAGVKRGALIMVTSALPGEGKTFCAVNLAMSIAMEIDTSVLLVDADVVRPAIMGRLGLPEERGLLDVLTDSGLDLSDVLVKTNVPKLSLLAAGTANQRSTELLASAAMDQLLEELATRYADRVVIFDAPPLLLTTEARVLASRVGQVVMVVDSSKTSQGDVARAFAAVEACPVVLSVLNKCPATEGSTGYGGYY